MYVSNNNLTRCETEAYLRRNIITYGNLFESGKEKSKRLIKRCIEKVSS